jgi:hypothetical protein
VALFGPDAEKIERWKQEGRVARLRSAIEGGGPFAEQAQQALVEIVADPSLLAGATDESVVEAFEALLNLDQHAASWALLTYVTSPAARAAVACRLIDRLASRETDAALLAVLRLAGCKLGDVGLHAVQALAGMNHPRLPVALRSALLLADRDALEHLLKLLEERQIPGASKVLMHRFTKVAPDLRRPMARALRRQGLAAASVDDPVVRAYLLVEEERFGEAVGCGPDAWQPLAEALGAQPEAGDRTARVLWALAQLDRDMLYRALKLRLSKAADEAIQRPGAAAIAGLRATAAWVLPALIELYGRKAEARELAAQVAAERFAAVQGLLEGM